MPVDVSLVPDCAGDVAGAETELPVSLADEPLWVGVLVVSEAAAVPDVPAVPSPAFPDPVLFSVVVWFVPPEYSTLELEVLSPVFESLGVDEDVVVETTSTTGVKIGPPPVEPSVLIPPVLIVFEFCEVIIF